MTGRDSSGRGDAAEPGESPVSSIPRVFDGYDLIKVYGPQMGDLERCTEPGKQPVGGTIDGERGRRGDAELARWLQRGGNVGLCTDPPVVAFDVDHAVMDEIVTRRLAPTYRTTTGSGGAHAIFRCPGWSGERRNWKVDGTDLGSLRADNQMVVIPPSVHPNGNRYAVGAGRPIATVEPGDIHAVVDELDAFRKRCKAAKRPRDHATAGATSTSPATATVNGTPEGVPAVGWTAFEDDQRLLEAAKSASNGAKVARLLAGNTAGYGSHSEADSALCWALAFYTRDPQQIDRIFRRSGLMRPKWDERHYADGTTYGERTVERAISRKCGWYDAFPIPESVVEDESGGPVTDGGRNHVATASIKGAYRALVALGGSASTVEIAESMLFDPSSKRQAENALNQLEASSVVNYSRNGRRGTWELVADPTG